MYFHKAVRVCPRGRGGGGGAAPAIYSWTVYALIMNKKRTNLAIIPAYRLIFDYNMGY